MGEIQGSVVFSEERLVVGSLVYGAFVCVVTGGSWCLGRAVRSEGEGRGAACGGGVGDSP